MLMAPAIKRWTVEEVRALPDDGNRYEVVDGELLVTPAPTWRHQDASKQLFKELSAYLDAHPVGDVWYAPADVVFDPETTMVEPDLFAVPLVEGRRPRTWEEAGRLLLAVEVLSPSSVRADRLIKRRLYQRQGVLEYWLVNVNARVIERWRPGSEEAAVITDTLIWHPDPSHPPLAVDLRAYFGEVWGE
jgi:Uma2 family endonuclease